MSQMQLSSLKISKTIAAVLSIPLNASTVRGLAWLAFIFYLLFNSPSVDVDSILACSAFIVAVAIHALIYEAQLGVRDFTNLLNAVWFGLLIYALPIYILSASADISVLLDIDPKAITRSAWLVYISIAVTGFTVELLRPWGLSVHRIAIQRIAEASGKKQFHVAALLVIIYGVNYINSGVLGLIGSGNRFEILQTFETGKMWLIQYLMTGVTIAFIYQYFKKSKAHQFSFYYGLASVVMFWAMYLSLGNRRGVLTIILAAVICYVSRSATRKRAIVMLSLVFIVSGCIGILRQDTSAVDSDQKFLIGISNFFGEFIYPGYTLVHTVELDKAATFEFTWLSMGYDFISAQLQGLPFTFYAHRFALDVAPSEDNIMGFAYLPITEAFQNFGAIGAAFSGVALLSSILFIAWFFRDKGWVYLLLLSLTLDINRSEFVAMLIQFVMIAGGFLLTIRLRLR